VASKIFGEASQALFLAKDLKRTLAGRSVDVRIFKCFAIQGIIVVSPSTRLVDTVNLVFANHTTYFLTVTNFGDYSSFEFHIPWYVAPVMYWRFLTAFLGVFPYVCFVMHNCPETHKTKLFLNLKAIALSGSKLVCYDQLLQCLCTLNKVFSKFLYSSTLSRRAAL
jgi:hypothetical protein